VYRDKMSCPWVKGFHSNDSVKEGYAPPSEKRRYFAVTGSCSVKRLQIGTDMLLIITSTGDRLFKFINIDDLEPSQNEFLENFWQFLAAAHILTMNCEEVAGDIGTKTTCIRNFQH